MLIHDREIIGKEYIEGFFISERAHLPYGVYNDMYIVGGLVVQSSFDFG